MSVRLKEGESLRDYCLSVDNFRETRTFISGTKSKEWKRVMSNQYRREHVLVLHFPSFYSPADG